MGLTLDLSGTAAAPDAEYFTLQRGDGAAIHLRRDAAARIAREVRKGAGSRGTLLGSVRDGRVWIDRHAPEGTWGEAAGGEGAVARYRLASANAGDPPGLVLLLEPGAGGKMACRFYAVDKDGVPEPAGEGFEVPGAESGRGPTLRAWWPLGAAIALAAGAVWMMPRLRSLPAATVHGVAETARPIGLQVDSAGATWRVWWNPAAVRGEPRLSVRDGAAEERIGLSAEQAGAGWTTYTPKTNDVTFRLEGRDRVESFRVARSPAPPQRPPATEAKAVRKVAPVVPAGIRPQLGKQIGVDVRVEIDASGRVRQATAVGKRRAGVDAVLAERAVRAARQWRFEPARRDGRPVAAWQTIHFSFNR